LVCFKYLAHGQRIKLKDIEVLTLYKDKLTASNRLGANPQVKFIYLEKIFELVI